tara:strand:+ start:4587 stop:5492 length:906 start_codon:yes stop_codon:yes gene_type:complete
MNTFKAITLGAAAICLLAGTSLSASDAYAADDTYKPNRKEMRPTRDQIEELGYTGSLPLDEFKYVFVHNPEAPEGHLTLRASIPVQVQGCYELYEPEIEQKIMGSALVLDTKMPLMRPPSSQDKNPDCDVKQSISVETSIDRAQLIENNITKMRFKSKYFTISRDMDITEHSVTLTDPANKKVKPYTYWSLPANAVVLNVPMFDDDLTQHDTQLQQLARVAKIKGLAPVEDQIPGYTPSGRNHNRFYFLDTKGDVLDLLKQSAGPVTIGQIHIKEPFYGPNGQYDKETGIDIIAMIPGSAD